MPCLRVLTACAWCLLALILLPITAYAQAWTSPHISITKVSSWSEFLDVLNQPHIDVNIHNDGSAAVGTVDFQCRLFLLDRAVPVFEGEWETTLDKVIPPSQDQTLKLEPNMFSDLGEVIQHGYRNAAWSCYVQRILTSDGRSIAFEPGAIQHKGPTLGISYAPVPQTAVGLLKLPNADGMMVLKIMPGSMGERLDIRRGDVIASVDGKPLKVVQDLTSGLDQAASQGHDADLTILRGGAALHVSIPEAGPAQDPVQSSSAGSN